LNKKDHFPKNSFTRRHRCREKKKLEEKKADGSPEVWSYHGRDGPEKIKSRKEENTTFARRKEN